MSLEQKIREISLMVSKRDFAKAQKAIEEVLAFEAQNAMAIGYWAIVKIASGDDSDGAKLLKQANDLIAAEISAADEDWVQDIWRQRRSNLGQTLFEVTGEDPAEVMRISRLIITDAGMNHERALKSLGVEAVRNGNFHEAVGLLKRAVLESPKYAPGWYNLGCAYAKLSMKSEMIEALKNAIEFGQSEYVMDYRPQIEEDDDFAAFRGDPEFVELVDKLPKDPDLNLLYRTLQDGEPDQVLRMGEKLRSTASDVLAVFDAMHEAARIAASDLDEHGSLHSQKYQSTHAQYLELMKKLKSEIGELKRSGARSKVFAVFSGD